MKTSSELPPNYEQINAAFHVDGLPVVFTYGDTLYNVPKGYKLPDHLIVHESVHVRQQVDPAEWWNRYITEPEFRVEQEIEAYGAQYRYFEEHFADRNARATFLFGLAKDLASPAYGSVIGFTRAQSRIRKAAKNIHAA